MSYESFFFGGGAKKVGGFLCIMKNFLYICNVQIVMMSDVSYWESSQKVVFEATGRGWGRPAGGVCAEWGCCGLVWA